MEIKMKALKVTKWFGFSLFCLVILTSALALVGLGAAQRIQDRSSQPDLIQEEGEQIDLLLPGEKAPQTAPSNSNGQDGIYLAGGAKTIDPSGLIPTGGIAAIDPNNGPVRITVGVRPTIDPHRGVGAFVNLADEIYEYAPVGHAVTLDPSGRIRGIALVNLANGNTVRIKAVGTTGDNLDDEQDSFLLSRIVKKNRRPKG